MMKVVAAFLAIFWSGTLAAFHSYGGLDLCTTYPEKMPPGIIDATQLPKDPAGGVALMQKYCEQCHYLPGPGRLTAKEWPVLLKQMNLLMDVSNRFGNLMGRVLTPTAGEREIIAAYLVKNALIPMEPISETIKGHAYERHCDNCHVLPDPAQHTFDEWHNVIERMLREMKVMKYSPPSDAEIVEIYNYLRGDVIEEETSRVNDLIEKRVPATELIKTPTISNGTWWAIGPFLLLVLLGVIRWWWSSYVRKSADAS